MYCGVGEDIFAPVQTSSPTPNQASLPILTIIASHAESFHMNSSGIWPQYRLMKYPALLLTALAMQDMLSVTVLRDLKG